MPKRKDGELTPRTLARALALEVLYEAEIKQQEIMPIFERRLEDEIFAPAVLEFARILLDGVKEHHQRLDEIIAQCAPGWPLDQLSPIDLNLLRIGAYELLYGDSPQRVVINEAVELAKRYGSENSYRFVNGVLGAVIRSSPAQAIPEENS